MGQIYDDAKEVYRAFETDGVPASGPCEPSKTDIIGLFQIIDSLVGGAISGATPYATVAALPASTGSNHIYLVTSDPTSANNGYWQDQSGGNVILTALNAALKGPAGLLAAATNTDLDAGTSDSLSVTPAGLSHLGLYVTTAPRIVSIESSLRAWSATTPTPTDNHFINASGADVSGNGYRYATLAVTADNVGAAGGIRVVTTVAGTGNPLASYYSDTAGTAFIGHSTELGGAGAGTAYGTASSPYALTNIPANTQCVKINGVTSQTIVIQVAALAQNIGPRLAAIETLGIADAIPALQALIPQTATSNTGYVLVPGYTVQPDGSTSASAAYRYLQIALTGNEKAIYASGTVVGASRHLATYYSDAACTTFLSAGPELGTADGTGAGTYNNQLLSSVPAGARGLRINSSTSGLTPAVWFQAIPNNIGQFVADAGSIASKWKGKKWAQLGDSITAMNLWQGYVTAVHGLISTNCGVGGTDVSKPDVSGTQISMCDDARINAIPSDTDLITFMGGVNDHGHNKPMGAITAIGTTTFDNTTFYGALETVATKLLARFPGKQRIIWFTLTFADRSGVVPSGWTNGWTNSLGLQPADYAAAIRAVALKYGFPIVDLIAQCGWNHINNASYVLNESGNFIHPMDDGPGSGAQRIAEIVNGRLSDLQPIS